MTFRPHPSRTITLGRGLFLSRQYPSSWRFARCFYFDSHQPPRVPTSDSSAPYYESYARRIPHFLPKANDGDIAGWIEALEQHLGVENTGIVEGKDEQEQCLSILKVLRQARATHNVDLLAHFAFRLKRWDAVHSIVNRLLDNIATLGRARPTPNDVPSNINWRALGVQNWGSPGILDQIATRRLSKAPRVPLSGDGKRTLANLEAVMEERTVSGRAGYSTVETETLQELWQSLGSFVLEAADLTERRSLAAMEHVYQMLARFQQLDLIPHSVYNDASGEGAPPSLSRAGMPFLQSCIMHVLADSTLEVSMQDSALGSGLRLAQRRFKVLRRELGVGIWLEFILWCCVENGFVGEGTWILGQMLQRSKVWHVKSWGKLLRSMGELDLRRVEYFDTWAECGGNATETRFFMSRRSFVGMGERTITTEVIFALMDGYTNCTDIDLPDQRRSLLDAWTGIEFLRSILKRDGLYLGPGDVNYLLSRSIESKGVLADNDPHSLVMSLNLAPYVMAKNEDDGFSNATPKCPTAIELGHGSSALALGLHVYALNIHASQGHILGMLHIFETFVGALGADRVHEMRRFAIEDRHLIQPSVTRNTAEYQQRLLGETAHNTFAHEILASILMWPVSLSLLLDALTVSRSYRLGNWLLRSDNANSTVIPPAMFSDAMLSPAIIRFAAATNNRHIFSIITNALQPPIPRETLRTMVTYQVENSSFDHAIRLLGYLPDRHQLHWGGSNVASIGAVIIRLDHESGPKSQKVSSDHAREDHLQRAKDVLAQILQGAYSRRVGPAERSYAYQEQELYQLHRILSSISGSVADVCRQVELEWKRSRLPPSNVPTNAFHHILTAITETRGCVAGKELWDRWCIDPFSSLAQEIRTGPNAVFQSLDNIAFRSPGPAAAPGMIESGADESGKLVVPNINTVRIISMRAIEQQMSIWRGYVPESDNDATKKSVSSVLHWCIRMFERFGLTEVEIDSEMEGQLARIRQENCSS